MYDNFVISPSIGWALAVRLAVSVLLNRLSAPLATSVCFIVVIGTNARIFPVPS